MQWRGIATETRPRHTSRIIEIAGFSLRPSVSSSFPQRSTCRHHSKFLLRSSRVCAHSQGENLSLPYSQFQPLAYLSSHFQFPNDTPDLQTTYSNFKNTLQQIASKIGDIEQEAEEHKFVSPFHLFPSPILVLHTAFWPPRFHLPCSRPPSIKPHCSPTYHHHTADLIII